MRVDDAAGLFRRQLLNWHTLFSVRVLSHDGGGLQRLMLGEAAAIRWGNCSGDRSRLAKVISLGATVDALECRIPENLHGESNRVVSTARIGLYLGRSGRTVWRDSSFGVEYGAFRAFRTVKVSPLKPEPARAFAPGWCLFHTSFFSSASLRTTIAHHFIGVKLGVALNWVSDRSASIAVGVPCRKQWPLVVFRMS